MRPYWFIVCFLLLQGVSCKKEEQLPGQTEKGTNTFGCKIEGHVFVPQRSTNFGSRPPLLAYYNTASKHFEVSVSENHDNSNNGLKRFLHLEVQNLTTGVHNLDSINTGEVSISQYDQPDQAYTTTQNSGGTVNINRLDTIARIISGTFSFKAAMRPTNTPGKIIEITEGRFDIRYD